MPRLRLDIDTETFVRLLEQSLAERRPPEWQAEVVLRRALGLPFPYPECLADRAGSRSLGAESEPALERVEGAAQ